MCQTVKTLINVRYSPGFQRQSSPWHTTRRETGVHAVRRGSSPHAWQERGCRCQAGRAGARALDGEDRA
jgi:hypothetical protein